MTITEREKRCEHWCKPANQALAEQDGLDTTNSEIFTDLPQYRLIRTVKGFPLNEEPNGSGTYLKEKSRLRNRCGK
jgi:hypothetical protein